MSEGANSQPCHTRLIVLVDHTYTVHSIASNFNPTVEYEIVKKSIKKITDQKDISAQLYSCIFRESNFQNKKNRRTPTRIDKLF